MMNDGHRDNSVGERKLKWDEENRLIASDDNGFVTNYWYDANGERTVKTSGESEAVYVNSEFAGGRTNTSKFSLYVSPYLVANQGGRYTKHIYIGSQRIVSKLGDFDSYGSDPRRIQYAGSETDGLSVDYKVKYGQQLQVIKDNYATFEVPYNGTDNDDYVDGEGFCCNDGSIEAAQARAMAVDNNFQEGDTYEKYQFYYHPDHLGSSSYITNLDGEVVQHVEYVPFGEVFIEERNSTWNTPYLFNGKEFDEETGLYYYGARYYDARLSLWMSVDPLQEKYPSYSTYCYTFVNPVRFIDPTGLAPTEEEAARIANHVYGENVRLIGGWKISSLVVKNATYIDESSGFLSALYERTVNGKKEYVYATAGSNDKQDWINNIKQVVGKSEQYDISMRNANEISKAIKNKELTFVGHSLGGGLAAANAYETGHYAMTFNAAWVSPFTISNRKKAKIDAFIHYRDELDILQRKLWIRANGSIHIRYSNRSLLGHSIENFYRSDSELFYQEIMKKSQDAQYMFMQNNNFPY